MFVASVHPKPPRLLSLMPPTEVPQSPIRRPVLDFCPRRTNPGGGEKVTQFDGVFRLLGHMGHCVRWSMSARPRTHENKLLITGEDLPTTPDEVAILITHAPSTAVHTHGARKKSDPWASRGPA